MSPDQPTTEFVFASDLALRAGLHYAREDFPEGHDAYAVGPRTGDHQTVVEYGYSTAAAASILRAPSSGPLLILMTRATTFECRDLLSARGDVRVVEISE